MNGHNKLAVEVIPLLLNLFMTRQKLIIKSTHVQGGILCKLNLCSNTLCSHLKLFNSASCTFSLALAFYKHCTLYTWSIIVFIKDIKPFYCRRPGTAATPTIFMPVSHMLSPLCSGKMAIQYLSYLLFVFVLTGPQPQAADKPHMHSLSNGGWLGVGEYLVS